MRFAIFKYRNPRPTRLVLDYLGIALIVWGIQATFLGPLLSFNADWIWSALNVHAGVPITIASRAPNIDLRPIYVADHQGGVRSLANARYGKELDFSPLTESALKGHVSVLLLGLAGDEDQAGNPTDPYTSVSRSFTGQEAKWLRAIKRHFSGHVVKIYFVRVNAFGAKGAVLLDDSFDKHCFKKESCVNGVMMFGNGPKLSPNSPDATARWWLSTHFHLNYLPREVSGGNSTWPVALVFDSQGRLRYNSATDKKAGFVNPLSSGRVVGAVDAILQTRGGQ